MKYPLEAARTLREHELEEAKQRLAQANEALAAAEHVALDAGSRARAHEDETSTIAARERARDAPGRSAEEMLRTQEWLAHRARELADLRTAVRDAEARVHEAVVSRDAAQLALAEARAAREAVERHHERYRADERRAAEARAEADADDLVARRPNRRNDP